MREFDEVGRTIEEFASEDATVVIGTVLDPEMQDEVRVTVVATGLNRGVARMPVRNESTRPVKLVRNATTGAAEYDADPRTTPMPGLRASATSEASGPPTTALDTFAEKNRQYLDIPAFLRRQAD